MKKPDKKADKKPVKKEEKKVEKKVEKKPDKKDDKKKPDKKTPDKKTPDKKTPDKKTPVKKIKMPQIDDPTKTRVDGCGERFLNMAKNNFRGLLGVLVPLCVLAPQLERFNNTLKLKCMWLTMFWFYLIQPVCVPVTSLFPVFVLPFGGIMNSVSTCKSYMNETVMLFILTGWLILLLNNSGLDKRIAFWFICSGNASQYNGRSMVFKCGSAAFVCSIFSGRLVVAYTLTEVVTNSYNKIIKPAKKDDDEDDDIEKLEPDYATMRDVCNNAIQTSAGIGGIAVVHSSIVTLLFRGSFHELAPATFEYPDVFNYLQYSAFAFPVAIIMFFCNILYHMNLVDTASSAMCRSHNKAFMKIIARENARIPVGMSLHEIFTGFFALLYLAAVFFRWNFWMKGWANYTRDFLAPQITGCKDATVAAIFVIILHVIPKGFGFLKIFGAKKKRDLPPHKPESAVLWYRYIDKNINYGYIFTYGSVFAILHAATLTKLDHELGLNSGTMITGKSWNIGILIIVVVAAILCNVMSPMAACSMWLPYVLLISVDGPPPWPRAIYLAALGVGIASNFGFCIPFQYTPAYYCRHVGRVPILKMVKYSIPSVIMCTIILYLALILYAPHLWGPGFVPVLPGSNIVTKPTTTTTTTTTTTEQPAAPPAGGPPDTQPADTQPKPD